MTVSVGDRAPTVDGVLDTRGAPVPVAGSTPPRHVLLVFLRYAACPMCLLHVRDLEQRYGELQRAGVDVVAVFHSPREAIARHTRRLALPFRVIDDPGFALYERYGVRSSWLGLAVSVVLPSFYAAFVRAAIRGFWGGTVHGDLARMPADFLIDPNGIVRAAHRGSDIGDHMSIDEVLQTVRRSESTDRATTAGART